MLFLERDVKMKKLFKRKSKTSKLLDEFAFLSPAVSWVNKVKSKNRQENI